jgi:zinc transport system substrate-binding protein
VVTTSYPVDWLVARLAGDRVNRRNILPPGEDAPFWEPAPETIVALAGADLIVANGAGFEAWMETANLPASGVVRSADGLELITTPGRTHSHGKEGAHSHAGIDPHTWGDPDLFYRQAERVQEALVRADTTLAAPTQAALRKLRADLDALKRDAAGVMAALGRHDLAANHLAFNYPARAYGFTVRSFDFDPEEVPAESALGEFRNWLAGTRSPVLLWEAGPAPAVAAAFPERVLHLALDPLEQPGENGTYDYLAQSRANLERISTNLSDLGEP